MDFVVIFLISPFFVSVASFTIGFAVVRILNLPLGKNFELLGSWLLGLILLNLLTSIVITKGLTVQICFIPLLAALYLISKNSWSGRIIYANYGRSVVLILLLNCFWSAFYFLCFYSFINHSSVEQSLYADVYYYVRIAESIWTSGNENILCGINFNSKFEGGTSPYHYFELYQSLIQSKWFNISSLWSFIVSVPVVFAAMATLCVASCIRSVTPALNIKLVYGMGVMLLFASGLNMLPFSYVEKGEFSLNIMNHVTPKYTMIFVLLILSGYCVFRRRFIHAAIFLCAVQVFSFMMTSVVLWGIFVGGLCLFTLKKINVNELFWIIGLATVTTLSIHVFYGLTAVPITYQRLAIDYYEVLSGLANNLAPTLKKILGTHFYFFLDYLIYLIPLAVWLGGERAELRKYYPYGRVALYFIILFEGGIVSTWILNDFHLQAWQPQYFTLCIGSVVLIIWYYLLTNESNKKITYILLVIPVLVCLVNIGKTTMSFYIFNDPRTERANVSKEFLNESKRIFADGRTTVGFLEANPRYPTIYTVGSFLLHIDPQINLECMDLTIIDPSNTNYRICSFYQYVNDHKPEDGLEELRLLFAKENNIRYFVGYGNMDTSSMLFKSSNEILRDSQSGLYIREIENSVMQ